MNPLADVLETWYTSIGHLRNTKFVQMMTLG